MQIVARQRIWNCLFGTKIRWSGTVVVVVVIIVVVVVVVVLRSRKSRT